MAGLYFHIPFCRKACSYCNFHFSTSIRGKEEMLEAMAQELSLRQDYLKGAAIKTIYFGGGTPSLLTADELNRLLEAASRCFDLAGVDECTLEANPDDLSRSYLQSLRSTPVNRLSIGVQSFRETDLRFMNRAHTAQQSDYAIKAAQDAGFSNLSIDLIYGTPGLNSADWQAALRQVTALDIPHLSAYALTVEEGTALHHQIKQKKTSPVAPELAAAHFDQLSEWAAANGYGHYEISNLAKPGCYAQHNTAYWQGVPYLGIGPSAHSFNGDKRSWNVANNTLYAQALLREKKLLYEEEVLTGENKLNEYIMTSLRTMWGCDLDEAARRFGTASADRLREESQKFSEKGWLFLKENTLLLTLAGRHFADRVAGELFQ